MKFEPMEWARAFAVAGVGVFAFNAIVPQCAQAFIEAYLEVIR
jgi:hypothetical protein